VKQTEGVSVFTIHPQIARITQIFFSFFVSKKEYFLRNQRYLRMKNQEVIF